MTVRYRPRTRTPQKADYEVGYKKPPKGTQYGPGQSGNPAGRPKNSKNTNKLVHDSMNEKMEFRENGELRTATKREVAVKALVSKAHKGDRRAFEILNAMDQEYQSRSADNQSGSHQTIEEMLAEDEEILADLLSHGGAHDE